MKRFRTRLAIPEDAEAIAEIYNQGIEERIATFETAPRAAEEVGSWIESRLPVVVVEESGRTVGWAAAFPYRDRACYAHVAEFSVYVARDFRRSGAGRQAMEALIGAAEQAGLRKLVSRVFPENQASLTLLAKLGFREVGVYRKHGQLDGRWRDVVIVERLLAAVD